MHLISPGLEKLKQLLMASAAFDQSPKAQCMSGTWVGIIKELLSDLKDSRSCLVWLKGSPGSGKLAIMKSICIELCADKIPVVLFFFNKNGSRAHTSLVERFVAMIAHQLARISNEFSKVLAELDLEESLRNISKAEQLEELVISPASRVKWSPQVVLVLDVPDECRGQHALKELMELARKLLQLPPAFAILILSKTSSEVYLPGTTVWMILTLKRMNELSYDAVFLISLMS